MLQRKTHKIQLKINITKINRTLSTHQGSSHRTTSRGVDDHLSQQRSYNQIQTLHTTNRDKRICNQMSTIDKTHTSDKIIWMLYFLRIQCKHFSRRLLWLGTLGTDMTLLIAIVTSNLLLALKRLVTLLPTLEATITLLAITRVVIQGSTLKASISA